MSRAVVHVAVAVITNKQNQVLISLRPEKVHQGGLWEFPGGKLEAGESVIDALKREISEELGIKVLNAQPLKTIQHNYTDKSVLLDVWKIDSFSGEPHGAEGQDIKWQDLDQLCCEDFPAANRGIIQTMLLPEKYMITGSFESQDDFLKRLESSLKNGISLVQLRCKNLTDVEYLELADKAVSLCSSYQSKLLLNTSPEVFLKSNADGLQLSSHYLHSVNKRPVDDSLLLSASCHTKEDIEQARKLNADIILLSPVKETKSHPGVKGIGWQKFSELISVTGTPVYALGGMSETDLRDAKQAGAQGVAAISSFWSTKQV